MAISLSVLFVEDSEQDVALMVRALRQGGFEPTYERVETAPDLHAALARTSWDVVLSDWMMPRLDAPKALAIVRAIAADMPFIIVSGAIGEEAAVEGMRAGAQDFITKTKLTRLVPAIARAVREAEVRRENRKLEEQLLVSDRMASVGTLAAGVGHEINNPLAAIVANLELVSDAFAHAKEEPLEEHLEELTESVRSAQESAERIRNIVRDLMIFSRSGAEGVLSTIDVTQVLDSCLRMAQTEIRHRARLVRRYDAVPPVHANESRLAQVFLNIIINAAHAIDEGHAEENEIRVSATTDDVGAVVVEIEDTGKGIPPEHLPRIFDAFYTTKPVGVGTGLGLAICQRILLSLGGMISAKTKVGTGTTFRITLPASNVVDALSPQAPPTALAPPEKADVKLRVLVVDDERAIGLAIKRTLSEHDVVAVMSGRDALDRIRSGEPFDVVLSDLMMPEMSGMELHAELAQLAPSLAERMVFMTAGAFTDSARDFIARQKRSCLMKPFDAASLRRAVRQD